MRRTITALALLAAGFLAGTVAPRASASDGLHDVVVELRGIHGELTNLRRAVEKGARP